MRKKLLKVFAASVAMFAVGYLMGEEGAYQRLVPEMGRLIGENDNLERRLARYGE